MQQIFYGTYDDVRRSVRQADRVWATAGRCHGRLTYMADIVLDCKNSVKRAERSERLTYEQVTAPSRLHRRSFHLAIIAVITLPLHVRNGSWQRTRQIRDADASAHAAVPMQKYVEVLADAKGEK